MILNPQDVPVLRRALVLADHYASAGRHSRRRPWSTGPGWRSAPAPPPPPARSTVQETMPRHCGKAGVAGTSLVARDAACAEHSMRRRPAKERGNTLNTRRLPREVAMSMTAKRIRPAAVPWATGGHGRKSEAESMAAAVMVTAAAPSMIAALSVAVGCPGVPLARRGTRATRCRAHTHCGALRFFPAKRHFHNSHHLHKKTRATAPQKVAPRESVAHGII
jgi:hypothetical protein